MTQSLYLIIEPSRKRWRGPRIARISKCKPSLPRPSEQALIRLVIAIPDDVLQPREIRVEVKREHVVQPTVTVQSEAAPS